MANPDEENPINAILNQQNFIPEKICFHKREYSFFKTNV